MKNNKLSQYQDIKREANDIAKRIMRYRNVKGEVKNWESIKNLEDKYCQLYDDLFKRQLDIENMIESLEPIERTVLRYRYIDNMKWEKIFRLIHYGQRQTHRIHKRAINKLNKS